MGETVKTVLRIDSGLYERVKALAEKEKRSINNLLVLMLERQVEIMEKGE